MVNARLHLICGNCGCNNAWAWEYIEKEEDNSELICPKDVYIYCRNCATLHSLSTNAEHVKDEG